MATYDHEEQETLASLKAWWARYGNLVLTAAIIVFSIIAAFNGYRAYQRSQATAASNLYGELQKVAQAQDAAKTRELTGNILENYGRTTYAPLAALTSAKVQFEAGQLAVAKTQLQWVIDKASGTEYEHLARVRMAAVLIDENAFDDALKVLAVTPPKHFEGVYADRKGDVLLAKGQPAEARKVWEEAYGRVTEKDPVRQSLLLKLELTGGAPKPVKS